MKKNITGMDKHLDANLFSIIDSSLEDDVKNGFYNKVLENRHRPEILAEPEAEPAVYTLAQNELNKPMQPKENILTLNELKAYSLMKRFRRLPQNISRATPWQPMYG
ncbi:MAG: hypothetical protein IPH84_18440 [Bacteroidales bacterium]|nr:hypothetical protein [Bacteroidales bacterium]